MSHWCEHCGGRYELQHYDRTQELAPHIVGAEYGPTGRLLAIEVASRDLLGALPGVLPDAAGEPYRRLADLLAPDPE